MDFYVEASAVVTARLTYVPTFAEQCATADEQYFEKICSNSNHMLHRLLPPYLQLLHKTTTSNLEFSLQLPQHCSRLIDCNFIIRMLYTNIY